MAGKYFVSLRLCPPSQNTTGMPVDECLTIRSLLRRDVTPWKRVNNRGVAEDEDGYFNGNAGYPAGSRCFSQKISIYLIASVSLTFPRYLCVVDRLKRRRTTFEMISIGVPERLAYVSA
jgi:hypothetical protein